MRLYINVFILYEYIVYHTQKSVLETGSVGLSRSGVLAP